MNITAAVVRDWAEANGHTVGKRGRVSHETLMAFLLANPRTAREIAAASDIVIGKRGRISKSTISKIAEHV
jgi:hypothetical protein